MSDPDLLKSALNVGLNASLSASLDAGKAKAKKWLLFFKLLGTLFALSGLAFGIPALIESNWWNVFWGTLLLFLGLPTLVMAFFLEKKLQATTQLLSTVANLKQQFDQQNAPKN